MKFNGKMITSRKQIKKAHTNIYCFSFINLKNLAKNLMKHRHVDSQS
jgi:hypothetical protein